MDINGFKSQQHRWTKGSIQTARKLLPAVLRSRLPWKDKVEAFFHLTDNVSYLLGSAARAPARSGDRHPRADRLAAARALRLPALLRRDVLLLAFYVVLAAGDRPRLEADRPRPAGAPRPRHRARREQRSRGRSRPSSAAASSSPERPSTGSRARRRLAPARLPGAPQLSIAGEILLAVYFFGAIVFSRCRALLGRASRSWLSSSTASPTRRPCRSRPGGSDAAARPKNPHRRARPARVAEMEIDPVCGMSVEPARAAATRAYDGRTSTSARAAAPRVRERALEVRRGKSQRPAAGGSRTGAPEAAKAPAGDVRGGDTAASGSGNGRACRDPGRAGRFRRGRDRGARDRGHALRLLRRARSRRRSKPCPGSRRPSSTSRRAARASTGSGLDTGRLTAAVEATRLRSPAGGRETSPHERAEARGRGARRDSCAARSSRPR